MNTNADNAPAPGMTGQVITHNLPSYNNEKNNAQGLEDAAGLPFGNDAVPEDEEQEHCTSNQTGGLFNFIRCNKIILGSVIGVVLLLFVTWISSAALTSSNNSNMVVESFNGAAFGPDSSPTSGPTSAKSGKTKSGKTSCIPNYNRDTCIRNTACPGDPTDDCTKCCGDCPFDLQTPECNDRQGDLTCSCGQDGRV